MSGVLGERHDVRPKAAAKAETPSPIPAAKSPATKPPASSAPAGASTSVVVDHLSLWKRMLAAAERDFERDGSGVERLPRLQQATPRAGEAEKSGRDKNGGG